MATLSLLYPDRLRPTGPPPGLHFAGGYDLAPLPVEIAVIPGGVALSRPDQDSGFVTTPWDVPDAGRTVVNTATLRQRPEPYRLAVELARGKLNAVRNQTAEWGDIGLDVSPLYREKLRAAGRLFGHAVVSDDPARADALANDLLGEAHTLANELVETYTQQVFRTRHQSETRIRTAFGARLEGDPPSGTGDDDYRRAFNAVRLAPVWKTIEAVQGEFDWSGFDALVGWALTAGLNVGIGPIVDLRPGRLPDWLAEHHGDWPTIAAYACEFAELVMVRYGERVGVWEVVAGFNHAEAIGLIEDDRLRLAARLLDAARQIDKEGELIIGLTQPWGEYRADPDANYSPLSRWTACAGRRRRSARDRRCRHHAS